MTITSGDFSQGREATNRAPRELVFDAWTDPVHLPHGWGPRGFTNTVLEIDIRPGGVWRFIRHAPDGTEFPNRIVYREIQRPERVVYVHDSDEEDDPRRFEVTVTSTEEGAKTRVTSRMSVATAEQRDESVGFGAVELGQQTLDRLAAHLAERGG